MSIKVITLNCLSFEVVQEFQVEIETFRNWSVTCIIATALLIIKVKCNN